MSPTPIKRRISIDEMVKRFLAGETAVSISKDAGISHQCVRQYLAKRGIVASGLCRDPRLADAIGLYLAGLSGTEAADAVGLHPSTVYGALTYFGITGDGIHRRPIGQN